MKVLVTGAAGFVGYHVSAALLARGNAVIGVDDLNPYYDVALKEARLARLTADDGFTFHKLDIAERGALATACSGAGIARVVHLAAQAGVRHSLDDPFAYARINVVGHLEVLELCRRLDGLEHLVYASSSSVYGGNDKQPFAETDRVDCQVSLYGATKKADELMSHSYGHLFGVPATGIRLFTVYGPWGGPTWRPISSRERSSPASRSWSSTGATCGVPSPTSTTPSAASSRRSTSRRRPMPPVSGTGSTTSATTAPRR